MSIALGEKKNPLCCTIDFTSFWLVLAHFTFDTLDLIDSIAILCLTTTLLSHTCLCICFVHLSECESCHHNLFMYYASFTAETCGKYRSKLTSLKFCMYSGGTFKLLFLPQHRAGCLIVPVDGDHSDLCCCPIFLLGYFYSSVQSKICGNHHCLFPN